jgi:hypothetical protein
MLCLYCHGEVIMKNGTRRLSNKQVLQGNIFGLRNEGFPRLG